MKYEKLSEELRVQRFRKSLSQENMAEFLGVSVPTYRSYEKNPEQLNLSQAIAISDKLDWNLLKFFLEDILQNAIIKENK